MLQKRNRTLLEYLTLLSFILLIVIYHVFGYVGPFGFDDMIYAEMANNLNKGIIDYHHHFSYRIVLIYFTSISYQLFGINDHASALPSMILAISIVIMIFDITRKKGLSQLIMALSLSTLSYWLLFYSDKLSADIYVAFSTMLSLYIIHKYKYDSKKRNPIMYGVALSFSLLFGFTSKGTIILLLPLVGYLILTDIILKKNTKFWGAFVIGTVSLLASYFLVFELLTGNFAMRFDTISQNGYLNRCSYDLQPTILLLKRISFQFINLATSSGMLTGYLFVFAYLFRMKIKRYIKLNNSFSFFFVSSIILFLSANFMSISYKAYVPMCLDPRHFLFLLPIVAIPSSKIVHDFVIERKGLIAIFSALLGVSILSYYTQFDVFKKLYLPLLILFGLFSVVKKTLKTQIAFTFLFFVILLYRPMQPVISNSSVNYNAQKLAAHQYVLNRYTSAYVLTNKVQTRIFNYYNEFKTDKSLTFVDYQALDIDTLTDKQKVLFLNWRTESLTGLTRGDLPYYAKNISSQNIVFENEAINLAVYELNDVPKKRKVLSTLNTFDFPIKKWEMDSADITNAIVYRGEFSCKIRKYSPVFETSIDSFNLKPRADLLISGKVFCYYKEETKTKLVLSIEDTSGCYVWKAKKISKYLTAYENWWGARYVFQIKSTELKPSSVVKIYVLNPDVHDIYLDDFKIDFFELSY